MCVRTPEIPCGSGAMQLPGFQQMAYAIGSRNERVKIFNKAGNYKAAQSDFPFR